MAVPIGWIKGTGDYSICEMTTQDPVLKHLDVGTKYMKNLVAGTIAIPQNKAYFTCEFDYYKGSHGSYAYISFISPQETKYTTGSYVFQINNTEKIILSKPGGADLFQTVVSQIAINIWYRIKITNTLEGEKTMYIKGGAFGSNWVLVDPTGGSGTNPVTDNTYTTSKFLVIDNDAGDCVANVSYTEGVIQ